MLVACRLVGGVVEGRGGYRFRLMLRKPQYGLGRAKGVYCWFLGNAPTDLQAACNGPRIHPAMSLSRYGQYTTRRQLQSGLLDRNAQLKCLWPSHCRYKRSLRSARPHSTGSITLAIAASEFVGTTSVIFIHSVARGGIRMGRRHVVPPYCLPDLVDIYVAAITRARGLSSSRLCLRCASWTLWRCRSRSAM